MQAAFRIDRANPNTACHLVFSRPKSPMTEAIKDIVVRITMTRNMVISA